MGIPNRGEGGGQGPPCRNAYEHIIEQSDLEKMYCRYLNFDSFALGFYPDAGFLFLNHLHLGPFCSFWSLLVYFWVGVWFQTFFRAYSHRLSTFILEVKCYLFVITSAPFGAFQAFLGPHWTIYEVWIRLKKNSGPTPIDYYHWFLK